MTSNNQRNIPQKNGLGLLKPQNPSLPRLGDCFAQRSRRPVFCKPIAAGPIWTISGKTQNGNYQYEGSRYAGVNCQKKSGKRNPPRWRQPESQSSC